MTQEWVEIERGAYQTQTKCKDVEIDVIVAPDTIMKNHPGNWVFGFAIGDQLIKHSKRNYPTHWSLPIKRLGKGIETGAVYADTQMRGMWKAYDRARERRRLLGMPGSIVR